MLKEASFLYISSFPQAQKESREQKEIIKTFHELHHAHIISKFLMTPETTR